MLTLPRATAQRALAVLLLFLALLLAACESPESPAPGPAVPTNPPPSQQQPQVPPVSGAAYEVFFSAPTGSTDPATYVNGPDTVVAADINAAQVTVDVAAFELNSPAITQALISANARGVRVRLVVDNEHGLDVALYEAYLAATDADDREDILDEMETPPDETTLDELYLSGIPIVDDGRGALMHNKFVIIDSTYLWTGSMNLTINGAYRNNNNFVRFRNQRMVQDYQLEFDEMFVSQRFGPRSPANTPYPQFSINGYPVEVYFAPEDGVVQHVVEKVNAARQSIRFMTFSFTLDSIGEAMVQRGNAGVTIQGVFETTGSETRYSEMTRLYCAGYDVRQDGGPFILHHKVIIIDDSLVLIGSFNFSSNATSDNDENLVILADPAIVALYVQEWQARYAEGTPPNPADISCN